MNILEGKLVSEGNPKIAIVAARFNEFIVSKLIEGARDGLLRHDVKEENIDLCWVPGSFEIPVAAKHLAESKKYDAVICLPTLAALPPKERPFFVSITENVPFARVLSSNTECPEVLSEPPKECAL